MKYELKDLEKAVEKASKDGALSVSISFDPRTQKLQIRYCTLADEDTVISLAEVDSGLWNDIAIIKRF